MDHFQDSNAATDDFDAWDDMEENYFDASDDVVSKPTSKLSETENPFDDGGEPDFAGWLAAQAQKKSGAGKSLPKGLSKPSSNTGSSGRPSATLRSASTGTATLKKIGASVAKPPAKAVPVKKIDTAPKATDDDDGWGEGW